MATRTVVVSNRIDADLLLRPTRPDALFAAAPELAGGWIFAFMGRLALVPAEEPSQVIQDMATAMDTMSGSPTLRARMGAAARARVHDHFSTHAWREQFRRWYREVADVSLRRGPSDAAGHNVPRTVSLAERPSRS